MKIPALLFRDFLCAVFLPLVRHYRRRPGIPLFKTFLNEEIPAYAGMTILFNDSAFRSCSSLPALSSREFTSLVRHS